MAEPRAGETLPKRIQRSRKKGWRMPEGAVYVGRGTPFGNPWPVAFVCRLHLLNEDDARLLSVHWFRQWLDEPASVENGFGWVERHGRLLAALPRLRGKDLACWCSLDQPCHADIGTGQPMTVQPRYLTAMDVCAYD